MHIAYGEYIVKSVITFIHFNFELYNLDMCPNITRRGGGCVSSEIDMLNW